jgi:hypothetical protein
MTLYLGNKPVGLCKIVEKEIAKEKFGATVDSFLGDVDADGNYVASSEPVEINLAGLKSVPDYGFSYKFYGIRKLAVNANDVVSVGREGFRYAFATPNTSEADSLSVSFDNLEVVDSQNAFEYACHSRASLFNKTIISFKKLKKIAASNAFQYFGNQIDPDFDEIFPSLEEISGNNVFGGAFRIAVNSVITLSKVKKITGSTSQYSSTIGGIYYQNTVWNFPSATEFTGYIWNISSSYAGEIHFAAANREAIEACEGYDYKWGFAGASLFFDL